MGVKAERGADPRQIAFDRTVAGSDQVFHVEAVQQTAEIVDVGIDQQIGFVAAVKAFKPAARRVQLCCTV